MRLKIMPFMLVCSILIIMKYALREYHTVFCRCIVFTLQLWQKILSNDFHTSVYSFYNYLQLFWQDSNIFLQHHLPTRQTIVVAKDIILAVVIPRWQTLTNVGPAVAVTSGLLSTLGTILAPLHVFSCCPLPVLFSSRKSLLWDKFITGVSSHYNTIYYVYAIMPYFYMLWLPFDHRNVKYIIHHQSIVTL